MGTGYDCDGNCLEGAIEDCNGICGGASFINVCGWCEDPNTSYGTEGFVGLFAPEMWTNITEMVQLHLTKMVPHIEGSDLPGSGWEEELYLQCQFSN